MEEKGETRRTLERYVDELTGRGSVQPQTMQNYRRDLEGFLAFLDREGVDDFSNVNGAVIWRWRSELRRSGQAAATIERKTGSVKRFFAHLHRVGLLAANPIESFPSAGIPQRPHLLSASQLTELVSRPQGDTPLALRGRALMELLCATALRLGEVVPLNVSDIDLDQGLLTVRGGRARSLPLPPSTQSAIERYLANGRPALLRGQFTSALFVSRAGQRLSRRGIELALQRWAGQAGLAGKVSPQRVRGSLAASAIAQGRSRRDVRRWLALTRLPKTIGEVMG